MKTGDSVKTTKLIRSQKTGVLLPRQGTFVRDIENLGRKLILVDFGPAGEEYLFPNEVLAETGDGQMILEIFYGGEFFLGRPCYTEQRPRVGRKGGDKDE